MAHGNRRRLLRQFYAPGSGKSGGAGGKPCWTNSSPNTPFEADLLAAAPAASPGQARSPPSRHRPPAFELAQEPSRVRQLSLLVGPPVPPSPSIVQAVRAQFITETPPEEDASLRAALEATRALPSRAHFRARLKHIGTQVASLKAAAGPGPSALRNAHIQLIYSSPRGPAALLQWVDHWSTGAISPWAASHWTGALARPFWKSDLQEAVRPILCAECLLKFAMGVLVKGASPQICEGVGPHKYGAGRCSGAHDEVNRVRSAARIWPHRALSPPLTLATPSARSTGTTPSRWLLRTLRD